MVRSAPHDRRVPTAAPPDPLLDPAVRAALQRLGSDTSDQLNIGGLPVRALADRFGTPFYAYDQRALLARTNALRAALPARIELLYSIKANPGLWVTAWLRAAGIGAEIASLGELELALAAGHAAAALRFAGPGKSDAAIATALARGLGCFHVESASELHAVAAAARARSVRAGIAVRVNLAQQLQGSRLRMGGAGARFGVDQDQVPALLRAAAADPHLQLRGLHVYAGTQCFDAAAYAHAARELCTLATGWERELSLPLDELDLGGGFGHATYLGDAEFDLVAAGRLLADLIAAHDRPGRRWLVELGRYLVGPCGVYVARVVRRKLSGDRVQLALDGGLHHCAIATGLGSVLRRPPLVVHATALRATAREVAALGGPLCTPQDQFAEAVALPPCQEGDLVAILGTGAYGQSFSPIGFLSHPAPAELLIADGMARIVRDRGAATDLLRGQTP